MEKQKKTKREMVLDRVEMAVADLHYYDRKDDADIGVGVIDDMIFDNKISIGEIVDRFEDTFIKSLISD